MLIKRVSDTTKLNWLQIWDLNVYEFLNYLRFDIEYKNLEAKELERWKQQH